MIVEEFIHFDSEVTLLTVRSASGTTFCAPIGHLQKDGDYIESWQPHDMSEEQILEAQNIAKKSPMHLVDTEFLEWNYSFLHMVSILVKCHHDHMIRGWLPWLPKIYPNLPYM